jgi:hypothetical protein
VDDGQIGGTNLVYIVELQVPILACFLVKIPCGKKMGVKQQMLCVKRILLSLPQLLSVVVLILHEVQFDHHPQMLRKHTFFHDELNFFLSEFF